VTHRPKAAVLSRIVQQSPAATARINDVFDIVAWLPDYQDRPDATPEWRATLGEIDALVVGVQPLDRSFLDAAPRLRQVVRVGTGTDNIDTEAMRERNISLTALAGMNAASVAEHAFALLLAAARHIVEGDALVRDGGWGRFVGRQLSGATLGLIGFGEIARAMVPKALGFGLNVVVWTRRPPESAPDGVEFAPFDEVVRRADFLSLHVPLTPATRHLIGAREIGLMNGTVLVNTARGGVVDTDALVAGLGDGHVAAAGLDVFDTEPPAGSPLLALPNVVLSPHTGGHSDRVNEAIATAVADVLLQFQQQH
jgi:phosphoglycerate dehydrogenase-like enzyme